MFQNRKETFKHRTLLHIGTCRHRKILHTRVLLHTSPLLHMFLSHRHAFRDKSFYTQKFVHTESKTHRRCYTQALLHTQRLLNTGFGKHILKRRGRRGIFTAKKSSYTEALESHTSHYMPFNTFHGNTAKITIFPQSGYGNDRP